jgi:hypothetical protein
MHSHEVAQLYLFGQLKFGDALCHPGFQLASAQLLAFFDDDGQANVLPIHLVLQSEADSLRYSWILSDNIVQLNRADLLAAFVDELLDAAGNDHIAIMVFLALVASAEKTTLGK